MAGKKGRSGRKREERTIVQIVLRLDPLMDTDLIAFFESIPKGMRPRAVIAALRGGIDDGQQIATRNETRTITDALDDMLDRWMDF